MDIESNLFEHLEGNLVENLFEFFDVINRILSNNMSNSSCVWRMSLLRRIGGRGALRNLWEKLTNLKLVKSRKRKFPDSPSDDRQTAQNEAEADGGNKGKRPKLNVMRLAEVGEFSVGQMGPPVASH